MTKRYLIYTYILWAFFLGEKRIVIQLLKIFYMNQINQLGKPSFLPSINLPCTFSFISYKFNKLFLTIIIKNKCLIHSWNQVGSCDVSLKFLLTNKFEILECWNILYVNRNGWYELIKFRKDVFSEQSQDRISVLYFIHIIFVFYSWIDYAQCFTPKLISRLKTFR